MKILITGACGHIGSFLAENVHKIKGVSRAILVDNLKSNRFNSLYNFEKKNIKGVIMLIKNVPRYFSQLKEKLK